MTTFCDILTIFYKKKLKAEGFRRLRGVTPEQWLQVPILSRSTVQQHRKDLQSRNIPEKHGNTHQLETSGSTGLPIKVTGTDVTQFFWRVCALRDHFWHQRDFSAKMAAIRFEKKGRAEYPGIPSSNWGVVTSGVIKTGPAVLLNSSTEISLQAKFLIHEEPDYFITYPSNLEALARYFMQEGLHLNKLRGVRALGETLGSEVRAACHEAWGVPLVVRQHHVEMALVDRHVDWFAYDAAAVMQLRQHLVNLVQVGKILQRCIASATIDVVHERRTVHRA